MGSEKKTIKAVDGSELEKLFERLGLLSDIKEGVIRCLNCGRTISFDNFGGVKMLEGTLYVFCDSPDCIMAI